MENTSSRQKFSYTALKAPFLTIVSILGGLMLVESCMLLLLVLLLITNIVLKCLLSGIIVLIILAMLFGVLLSALRTRHSLSASNLYLHYGHLFNIMLPRMEIQSAQPTYERLSLMDPISARYNEKQQRITACFSEQGQVLLTLREPLSLRLGQKTKIVKTLLINLDQRERFLDELHTKTQVIPSSEPLQEEKFHLLTQNITKTSRTTQESRDSIALHVEGLTRHFKQFVAVEQLNMQIRSGEIYGLLGSNGAGKTTTIKMLVGLLTPNAGRIEIAGYDLAQKPEEVKRILGYVPDRSLLYERLSGREYLEFLAQVRGLDLKESEERIENLLNLLELKEQSGRLCGSYSFGMKRKLSLAGALLHQPHILILDEPLNGLDPRSARRLKDLFLELAAAGTTILLSTHDLATAEEVCDRVGIFHRGCLLAEGSAVELRQIAKAADLESVFLNLTSEKPQEVLV